MAHNYAKLKKSLFLLFVIILNSNFRQRNKEMKELMKKMNEKKKDN